MALHVLDKKEKYGAIVVGEVVVVVVVGTTMLTHKSINFISPQIAHLERRFHAAAAAAAFAFTTVSCSVQTEE